jgi:predicted nucleotidyltransferase
MTTKSDPIFERIKTFQRRIHTMDAQELHMPHHHKIILNHFIEACQADERVVAAFLGGSHARGTNDVYSDLDLGLILTDETYEFFLADCKAFIQLLGEPVFLEVYQDDNTDTVFSIFSDGTEVELLLGRESSFNHIHVGQCKVLLDKNGILAGAIFSGYQPTQAEQIETLRGLINWFWYNLTHHFITPIARGQLWSAYGALEDLRLTCVNMARLRQNFSKEAEGYEKVEQAVPVEQLAALQATFCPMERDAMLQAALTIVDFYQELAPSVAQAHGIPYPADLARVMSGRLEFLCNAHSN